MTPRTPTAAEFASVVRDWLCRLWAVLWSLRAIAVAVVYALAALAVAAIIVIASPSPVGLALAFLCPFFAGIMYRDLNAR